MRFDMMFYAEQDAVLGRPAESFHLGLCSTAFKGHEVVAVHTRSYPTAFDSCRYAVTDAPLAQAFGTLPHDSLGLFPPLVIEQPHVFGSIAFHNVSGSMYSLGS